MTEEKTDISLEERLAKRLAVRLPNYDDGRADTAVVRVALECALSDLALHCHDRREDVAWGIASGAAEDAHVLATFVGDWIEDMEDEG